MPAKTPAEEPLSDMRESGYRYEGKMKPLANYLIVCCVAATNA